MHAEIPWTIITLIVIGYLAIAGQMYIAGRNTQSTQGSRAMWLLVGIFILCSLAGYAPRLVPALMPYELAIHVALVLATWWFVFTNQAAHIMKALR